MRLRDRVRVSVVSMRGGGWIRDRLEMARVVAWVQQSLRRGSRAGNLFGVQVPGDRREGAGRAVHRDAATESPIEKNLCMCVSNHFFCKEILER